jgi:hypothetical protein
MLETIIQGLFPNSYVIWPVGRKQVAERHVQYHNGKNKVESKTKSVSGRTAMATLARCLYVVQRKVDGSKRSDDFYRALRGREDSMLSLQKGVGHLRGCTFPMFSAHFLHHNLPVELHETSKELKLDFRRWRYTSFGVMITSSILDLGCIASSAARVGRRYR